MPTCHDCASHKLFPILLAVLTIVGAFGCGSYSLWLLVTRNYGGISAFRMTVALVYLTAFSAILPSAELGFMRHPHLQKFARFLMAPMGRAFLLIFMGGVILGNGVGGWIVGIYLLAVGVFSIIAGISASS